MLVQRLDTGGIREKRWLGHLLLVALTMALPRVEVVLLLLLLGKRSSLVILNQLLLRHLLLRR